MKTYGLKGLGLLVVLLGGFLMVAPSAFAANSSGYAAMCKDGSNWTGTSKRGACRGHKGVKSWTREGGSSKAATEPEKTVSHASMSHKTKSEETAASAPATTGSEVTASCKDGSSRSGKSKRGACRGHKGVKSWSGEETAAAAPKAAAPMQEQASTHTATRSTRNVSMSGGSMSTPAPGGGNGKVWVNTGSKTYHCQGSKWYGTTKHGEYVTEAQAKAQGDHADHGKVCSQ